MFGHTSMSIRASQIGLGVLFLKNGRGTGERVALRGIESKYDQGALYGMPK